MRKNKTYSEERKKNRCRLGMKREREREDRRGREGERVDILIDQTCRQPDSQGDVCPCAATLWPADTLPPPLILGLWRQTGGRAWVCMHLCHVCVKRACACLCIQLYISIRYLATVSVCVGCLGPASSRASGVERLLPRGIN